MGQHKHNTTAIAAKNGELPPKSKPTQLSKKEAERLLMNKIYSMLALPNLEHYYNKEYK